MPPPNDPGLVASADFDSAPFLKGIDAMIGSVTVLTGKEAELQASLVDTNKAIAANQSALKANETQMATLTKTSASYNDELSTLTDQHDQLLAQHDALQGAIKATNTQLTGVTTSATRYKDALNGLSTAAKQTQQNGKNLFDSSSLNQQIAQVTQLASKFRDIFKGKIDTSELDDLEQKLAGTSDQFEKFRDIIGFVQSKLKDLDPNSAEFKDLSQVVAIGTDVLDKFGQVQARVNDGSKTIKAQLRGITNEMSILELAGKKDTKEFEALSDQAAVLQHQIDKTSERVRVFSSNTTFLQGGVEAIRGLAAGFELAAGASALFGVQNQAVEESIKRLQAIMAIANGLQEVSNLLKKESALRLVTETVATNAYSISQRVLAATLGTTAAASRGLTLALAATGIGAIVAAIGLIIAALAKWSEESKKAAEAQENLNVAVEQGIKDNEARFAGIDESNQRLAEEVKLRQIAATQITVNEKVRLQEQQKNAEAGRLIAEKTLLEQLNLATKFTQQLEGKRDNAQKRLDDIAAERVRVSDDELAALLKTIDNFNTAEGRQFDLENKLQLTRLKNQAERIATQKANQELQLQQTVDFTKRLQELQRTLADTASRTGPQNEEALRKQADVALQKELASIDQEVLHGTLRADRANVLKNVLKQINDVSLTKELKDFNKKVTEAAAALDSELTNLRIDAATERANLLRDELTREATLITINEQKTLQKIQDDRRTRLQGIQDQQLLGILSPQAAERASAQVEDVYQQLFLTLEEQTTREQEKLARLSYQRSQDLVSQLFAPSFANLSEAATKQINALTQRFVNRRITYEQYQFRLTTIARQESQKRIELQIAEDEQFLKGVELRLSKEQDPKEREALQARIIQLREEISQLRRQAAEGEADQEKANQDEFKKKVERIASFAQAIGNVVDQVVKFWQVANEAEQKALEKSIALQQTRVDAAVRVAERGNSEYLRLEEERLQALQLKQENAARRQLAINAVLQASQALVAFTSALAQGISLGGPLGGIAIAGAVLGLLASGYAIVQSLQQQSGQQKLFEGTQYVERNGAPSGIDTIPAMLTEGEGVLPKDINRAFRPTVAAMFAGDVNPEDMNAFVSSYRRGYVPQLAYDRMGDAATTATTYDGRLLAASQEQLTKLGQQAELLEQLNDNFKHLDISMVADSRGIAMSVSRLLDHNKKQARV